MNQYFIIFTEKCIKRTKQSVKADNCIILIYYKNKVNIILIFSILFSTNRVTWMKAKKLAQRINNLKAASDFQHKLIDTIYSIMSLKKKAEIDYRTSLQNINRQLERYIFQDTGFLTEMMRTFQAYIAVTCQNQTTLIDGYQNQILLFLKRAKQSKLEQQIIKQVEFVDSKIVECREKINHFKKLIRQNQQEMQVLSGEVTFKNRINQLGQQDKKKMAEKYADMQNLKRINQENLQQQVDGMMDLTMQHNTTVQQLNEYQTFYLEQKALDVYDNFMRAFIFQVSYNRNMQNDVTSILTRVNDKKQENKKIAFDNLRRKMKQNKGIKDSFWDTYKKWTSSEIGVDINESYINPRIREKWRRVCEYYNQIM